MGVLDDAIREHLELKRRHGVAEEEVRRQEEEALGPARREVAPAEEDNGNGAGEQPVAEQEALPAADAAVADETHPPEPELPHAAEELQADELPEEIALSEDAEASGLELAEEPVLHETDEHGPALADDDPRLSAEPPETGVEDSPLEETPAGQETAGYDVEDAFAEEDERPAIGDTPPRGFGALDDDDLLDDDEAPGGDDAAHAAEDDADEDDADVLEDTPDFLQETPEHDRLWFEQKPPRDFDFD